MLEMKRHCYIVTRDQEVGSEIKFNIDNVIEAY